MVVATIFSGALITRIGYYTPFMIFGTCLMSIGAGLLTTLQVDTGSGKVNIIPASLPTCTY
jgi:hypothetical protein